MKRKNRQEQWLLPLGIVAVLAFGLLASNTLDITGSNTHTVTVDGHTFDVAAIPDFGSSQFPCGGKQPSMTDESTSNVLKVTGRIPNTDGRDCSNYLIGTTVILTDLDLRTVERVTITRAANINTYSKGGDSFTSDLNGLSSTRATRGEPLTKSWGIVTITNDPAARVLRIYGDGDDSAGKVIPYSDEPVYFTNIITTTTKGVVYGATLDYQIQSIQVTPLPVASTPATATPVPATNTSTPTTGTTLPAQGFFARLLEWIKGWLT